NPLLREFNCAAVVVHHTNKPPTGKEKPDWSAGDFAYLGGGSAEWANWARAVLGLRSLGSHDVFELRAGKRGGRLGWKEEDGETSRNEPSQACFPHSTTTGATDDMRLTHGDSNGLSSRAGQSCGSARRHTHTPLRSRAHVWVWLRGSCVGERNESR